MNGANYTIRLCDLMAHGFKPPLDDYPIFKESYRSLLNRKIINHYYFREIGADTPDRFCFYWHRRMQEIMPYYNALYNTALRKFDFLETEVLFYDLTENKSGKVKNTGVSDNSEHTNLEGTETGHEDYNDNKVNNLRTETTNNKHDVGEMNELRTDNLKEVTTNDLRTEITDNKTDDGHIHDVRTDDLNTTTNITGQTHLVGSKGTTSETSTDNTLHNTGEGHTTTTGSKDTKFSDVPQAGVRWTTHTTTDPTTGQDIITVDNYDYLTTRTMETTSENSNNTTDEQGISHTQVEGQVNESSDDTTTQTGLNTEDKTGTVTSHNEHSNIVDTTNIKLETGTVTLDKTGTVKTDTTHENQIDIDDLKLETGNVEDTAVTDNLNTTSNNEWKDQHSEFENNEDLSHTIKNKNKIRGRKGFSPAQLLKEFREQILNIDLMIISALDTLFMGVYSNEF